MTTTVGLGWLTNRLKVFMNGRMEAPSIMRIGGVVSLTIYKINRITWSFLRRKMGSGMTPMKPLRLMQFVWKWLLHQLKHQLAFQQDNQLTFRRHFQQLLQLVSQLIILRSCLQTFPLHLHLPFRQTNLRLIQQIPQRYTPPSIQLRIQLICLRQIQHPLQPVSQLITPQSCLRTCPPYHHLPSRPTIPRLIQQIPLRFTPPSILLCIQLIRRRQIQHPLQPVGQLITPQSCQRTWPPYYHLPPRPTILRLIQQIPLRFTLQSILLGLQLLYLHQIQHQPQLPSRLHAIQLHPRQKIQRLIQQIPPHCAL